MRLLTHLLLNSHDIAAFLTYFLHGWQASASCLITWAHYLVLLFLIISLCNANVDEEFVKGMCPRGEQKVFYVIVLLGFLWGILQLSFISIRLTSRCDEAELKLLRDVNTETHELVLRKKRSEVSFRESCSGTDSQFYINVKF